MASMSGYLLNYDAWDHIHPETKKITRYKKGDKRTGVEIDDDRLKHLLDNSIPGRPMFVKSEDDVYGAGEGDPLALVDGSPLSNADLEQKKKAESRSSSSSVPAKTEENTPSGSDQDKEKVSNLNDKNK
jgi:hypothetical protein